MDPPNQWNIEDFCRGSPMSSIDNWCERFVSILLCSDEILLSGRQGSGFRRDTLIAVPNLTIRPATPEDAPACAKICYEAFREINTRHGFPPDLSSVDQAAGVMSMMFGHPGF